jgi:hypothetical protein
MSSRMYRNKTLSSLLVEDILHYSDLTCSVGKILYPYNTQWQILQGVPPIEVYRASIENKVGLPAFATEMGSS